jgi:hypothetical protein
MSCSSEAITTDSVSLIAMRSTQICLLQVGLSRRGTSRTVSFVSMPVFILFLFHYSLKLSTRVVHTEWYASTVSSTEFSMMFWNIALKNKYSWSDYTCLYCTLNISTKHLPPSPLEIASLSKQNEYDASRTLSLLFVQIFGDFPILSLTMTLFQINE